MTDGGVKDIGYFQGLASIHGTDLHDRLKTLLAHRQASQQEIKDEVQLRWQQGRCQEIQDLVNDIEAAHKTYMDLIAKRRSPSEDGREKYRF